MRDQSTAIILRFHMDVAFSPSPLHTRQGTDSALSIGKTGSFLSRMYSNNRVCTHRFGLASGWQRIYTTHTHSTASVSVAFISVAKTILVVKVARVGRGGEHSMTIPTLCRKSRQQKSYQSRNFKIYGAVQELNKIGTPGPNTLRKMSCSPFM